MKKISFLALILLFLLSGCYYKTYITRMTNEQIMSKLHRGSTPYTKIYSSLGNPCYICIDENEFRKVIYRFQRKEKVSSQSDEVEQLLLIFDRSDRLVSYKFSVVKKDSAFSKYLEN